jgi:hypothetical protein
MLFTDRLEMLFYLLKKKRKNRSLFLFSNRMTYLYVGFWPWTGGKVDGPLCMRGKIPSLVVISNPVCQEYLKEALSFLHAGGLDVYIIDHNQGTLKDCGTVLLQGLERLMPFITFSKRDAYQTRHFCDVFPSHYPTVVEGLKKEHSRCKYWEKREGVVYSFSIFDTQ